MNSVATRRVGEVLKYLLTGASTLAIAAAVSISSAAELPELDNPSTGSGQPTVARFFGGATADNGSSYLDSYSADTTLDILTEIHIEPGHVNSTGNLYLVVSADDQLYMLTGDGSFQPWDGELASLAPSAMAKTLLAVEPLAVLEDIAFSAVGINQVELLVYPAYDSQVNPGELYYSGTPLTVSITAGSQIDAFELYAETVSEPIIQTRCIACHNATGIASASKLVYLPGTQAGYQQSNFDMLSNYILNEPGGSDLILSKVQGISHGGGVQLTSNSNEFAALSEFVTAVLASSGGGNNQAIFNEVQSLDARGTLRKAALLVAGRLPSADELASVQEGDEAALRQAVRGLMADDGFEEFLLESANDRLLTRAFSNNLFNIVDRYRYPDSMQYYQVRNTFGSDRQLTGQALAEEPLKLISHVVMNERPYTEVLTADYIMVNPYSAAVYGGNVVFDNPDDPDEWSESEITEYYRCSVCARNDELANYNIPTQYPHAGILNSPAFLARFPSTGTNRNRARSRWAYYFFLGVDIEGLSQRTTDPGALADENNPTLNNPNCTVCHDIMDPVAGAFQNYGDDGFFRDQPGGANSLPRSYRNDRSGLFQPGDTWYADVLMPGFGEQLAPDAGNSLQWLAQEFVADSRFGYGTVNFWYPAVIGREPLAEPENPEDLGYAAKIAAYAAEQQFMQSVASDFVGGAHGTGSHNLKDLLVDLVMSDYFRAESSAALDAAKLLQLDDLGVGRLLSPEQLNRKLIETTGFDWSYGRFSSLDDVYRLLYGGIDSFSITERATELTTLMSTVVTAMANETSCAMVAQDFGKPQNLRLLFPLVELASLPTTSTAAIRSNIQYLHDRLLGEALALDEPEIDATLALFAATWNARIDAEKGDDVSSETELCLLENAQNPVTSDPNQTLRSWAVVINYLLRDYKFIHE